MATSNEKNLKDTDTVHTFEDVVKFQVAYPKDYKKAKHIKEGEVVELHKLQADNWAERGLGKIVK